MILTKNIYWHLYWGIKRLWKDSFFTWTENWTGKDAWEGSRVGKSSCNKIYIQETSRWLEAPIGRQIGLNMYDDTS